MNFPVNARVVSLVLLVGILVTGFISKDAYRVFVFGFVFFLLSMLFMGYYYSLKEKGQQQKSLALAGEQPATSAKPDQAPRIERLTRYYHDNNIMLWAMAILAVAITNSSLGGDGTGSVYTEIIVLAFVLAVPLLVLTRRHWNMSTTATKKGITSHPVLFVALLLAVAFAITFLTVRSTPEASDTVGQLLFIVMIIIFVASFYVDRIRRKFMSDRKNHINA